MNTRIFIMCPRVKTGGPENMHQFCHQLNAIGADAAIYYHPNPDRDYSVVYPEYGNVRVATEIVDSPSSVIVIPEILLITDTRSSFPESTIAIWWLSYVNAALFGTLNANLAAEAEAVHFFHSYFEYSMLRPHLSWTTWWFFLTSAINDEYLELDTDALVAGKRDVVCFNGMKDRITRHVCEELGIPYISIAGMNRDEVQAALRECKVYVDNGFHPGKDLMPREAALNGCVVITNRSGSAANFEDVPIDEKVLFEWELYDIIPKVLGNYQYYYDKQASYRDAARSEKQVSDMNVAHIWAELSRSLPPRGDGGRGLGAAQP